MALPLSHEYMSQPFGSRSLTQQPGLSPAAPHRIPKFLRYPFVILRRAAVRCLAYS